MKIQKVEGKIERAVLTAMIVNSQVLGNVAAKWTDDGLFKSEWGNLIGKWCIKYFTKYGKAPAQRIETSFANWATDKRRNPEQVELINKFLSGLSGEYNARRKEIDVPHILDTAGELFNGVILDRLKLAIESGLNTGKLKETIAKVSQFGPIEILHSNGTDFFTDRRSVVRMVKHQRESLFNWSGDLGLFYGMELEREGFLAFMAPEKRGKTWNLIDVAYTAMLKRRRVAFFEVGDLSELQTQRRFAIRACGRPLKATRPDKPIKIPVKFLPSEDSPEVEFKVKKYKTDLTTQDIWERFQEIQSNKIKSQHSFLRMSVHPNSSISVQGIRSVLDSWKRNGWEADVIVIDYADILAAPPGFHGETRDAINENWKQMRRMSQELKALVVTATQASANSYSADNLDMTHFSEDKRKFAHVTGMIGINQTQAEKELQITRLNWLVLREDEFYSTRHVWLAGCLSVGNPSILSCLDPSSLK